MVVLAQPHYDTNRSDGVDDDGKAMESADWSGRPLMMDVEAVDVVLEHLDLY